MTPQKTFNGTVQHGDESGRTIGFRTANFDPFILSLENLEKGVYASEVIVAGKPYRGVLYYGPRLVKGETHTVLEIHILDFNHEIYGQPVTFTIGAFIRGVMPFKSMEELQRQLREDVAKVRASS